MGPDDVTFLDGCCLVLAAYDDAPHGFGGELTGRRVMLQGRRDADGQVALGDGGFVTFHAGRIDGWRRLPDPLLCCYDEDGYAVNVAALQGALVAHRR